MTKILRICGSCTFWHAHGNRCHYPRSKRYFQRRAPIARACKWHLPDTQLVGPRTNRGPRTIPQDTP